MALRLIVLAGDGVGPEVTAEALRVLAWFRERRGLELEVREETYGLRAFRDHGGLVSEAVFADCLDADAVLFGATGGPGYEDVPVEVRRKGSLLALRKAMDVFANLRPVAGLAALAEASPLKAEVRDGVDLVVVRELTGGLYFGEPRGIERLADGTERGVNTQVYTTGEIERIARAAFDLALGRRGSVCSVDKSNVMESGALWRRTVARVGAEEYPGVALSHMLADNAGLQIVRAPRQFDVILADNMFGDILSDVAAAIPGSLGMLPSASLGAPGPDGRRRALYEPVHGSAPDIAGRGIANPLGAILSLALALEHSFGRPEDAARLRDAVEAALDSGARTADIAGAGEATVSTAGMGEAVAAALERPADAG